MKENEIPDEVIIIGKKSIDNYLIRVLYVSQREGKAIIHARDDYIPKAVNIVKKAIRTKKLQHTRTSVKFEELDRGVSAIFQFYLRRVN